MWKISRNGLYVKQSLSQKIALEHLYRISAQIPDRIWTRYVYQRSSMEVLWRSITRFLGFPAQKFPPKPFASNWKQLKYAEGATKFPPCHSKSEWRQPKSADRSMIEIHAALRDFHDQGLHRVTARALRHSQRPTMGHANKSAVCGTRTARQRERTLGSHL